jgi:cellulose biosynthesis protein BcsQ
MSGAVVTFYSFKGGVGRSFALANISVILAEWGYRVLTVDWDIEAPGLEYFFARSVPAHAAGVLQFLADCQAHTKRDWDAYVTPVHLPSTSDRLYLMPAASLAASDSIERIQKLDWDALFERHALGEQLEQLRRSWVDEFDLVLVDSRTGVTDFSGVTTALLPDILTFMFTANQQSLLGCCEIVHRAMEARRRLPLDRPALVPLPVPARFELRDEYDHANAWRRRFAETLQPFYNVWAPDWIEAAQLVDLLTIPYVPRWTFGEELCALHEPALTSGTRSTSQGATYALETLAALLANNVSKVDLLAQSRDEYVRMARASVLERRRRSSGSLQVFLSAVPDQETRALVESIRLALQGAGYRVFYAPDDLIRGDKWHVEIPTAIERSDALVSIVGTNYSKAQDMQVERFLRHSLQASGSQKPIIPVVLPSAVEAFRDSRLAYFNAVAIDPAKPLPSQIGAVIEGLANQRNPFTA